MLGRVSDKRENSGSFSRWSLQGFLGDSCGGLVIVQPDPQGEAKFSCVQGGGGHKDTGIRWEPRCWESTSLKIGCPERAEGILRLESRAVASPDIQGFIHLKSGIVKPA